MLTKLAVVISISLNGAAGVGVGVGVACCPGLLRQLLSRDCEERVGLRFKIA
jgi:hypothetical protein